MSKLHRLFHLTRVTEYLPPAEPIHRGKCFGKICSYHLFLSAVDLKSKDKTILKGKGKLCTHLSHRIYAPQDLCLPFMHPLWSFRFSRSSVIGSNNHDSLSQFFQTVRNKRAKKIPKAGRR